MRNLNGLWIVPFPKRVFERFLPSLSYSTITDRQKQLMGKALPKQKPIPNVKDIILVSSGKGGVGKSTTAVNIAIALKELDQSKSIGLLDADVFGPSVPLLMNLNDSPLLNKDNLMEPLHNYGIKCMSMGFLIAEGAPLIWRGLMVMQAIEKLMRQVCWGETDILIVDTPPGTGDTHLSLVQNLPITGAILVSTPQTSAIEVTKRGAVMFNKLNVPIIGIIENMSSVQCPKCQSDIELFGEGIQRLADELNIKVIGKLPLDRGINRGSDIGVPIVIGEPNSQHTKEYKNISNKLIEFIINVRSKQIN